MSPAAGHPVILEADAISKRFGDRQVLNTAWLRARTGLVTGLLGRNGAGKSTLLRCAAGLLAPDNGSIRFDGIAYERVRLAWIAQRGVFFLPDRDLLHPGTEVGVQLRWIAQMSGTDAHYTPTMTRLRIDHVLRSKPHQLSGGEKRRAEIATALLRAPRVFILDEPLRGIAPLDVETILSELRMFAASGGAVIVTGHELPMLMPALDTVTWCHLGRTREFESVAAAQDDHQFRQYYMPWRR